MTRDKVGVGWQHSGGAGGPKCGFSVGCVGGRGHRHQDKATSQRDGGGAGSSEPGATGQVQLFRSASKPTGRLGRRGLGARGERALRPGSGSSLRVPSQPGVEQGGRRKAQISPLG